MSLQKAKAIDNLLVAALPFWFLVLLDVLPLSGIYFAAYRYIETLQIESVPHFGLTLILFSFYISSLVLFLSRSFKKKEAMSARVATRGESG